MVVALMLTSNHIVPMTILTRAMSFTSFSIIIQQLILLPESLIFFSYYHPSLYMYICNNYCEVVLL